MKKLELTEHEILFLKSFVKEENEKEIKKLFDDMDFRASKINKEMEKDNTLKIVFVSLVLLSAFILLIISVINIIKLIG